MEKTFDETLDELYALSKKVAEQEKLRYQPRNKKEEQEFLEIAKDTASGRRPFSFTRNGKTYSYAGDIWYSEIAQVCKKFSTYDKRTRCNDYVHDYLKKNNFNIHS